MPATSNTGSSLRIARCLRPIRPAPMTAMRVGGISLEEAGRLPAIDRDRGALDVARALGAQEQRHLGDVLRLPDAAQAVLLHQLLARRVRRDAACLRALLQQCRDAIGLGQPRMDDIDVDAVALAEPREPFGE